MDSNGAAQYGREEAWRLLTEWTQSDSLRKHALCRDLRVVMRRGGGGPAGACRRSA